MKSPPLLKMPEHIVLIDPHNFAKTGTHLAQSLSLRFDVHHLLGGMVMSDEKLELVQSLSPKETLVIIAEPGSPNPATNFDEFLYRGLYAKGTPFALCWLGSIYRVLVPRGRKISQTEKLLRKRRNYFNSLTPIRFCLTEDLIPVDIGSVLIGNPMPFPTNFSSKDITIHLVVHTPTGPEVTDLFKGTNIVREGFELLKNDVETEIIEWKPGYSNHDMLMQKLDRVTMFVHIMADLTDSGKAKGCGIGCAGIEAMAHGCLLLSKMPQILETPVVQVETAKDVADKVRYYMKHPDEYEKRRKEQFEWAQKYFSLQGVCDNVYRELQKVIG